MNYDITDILSDGFAYGKIKYVAFNNEINEDNDICLKKEAFKNALKKSLEQINELKNALRNKKYTKLSKEDTLKHRKKFNNVKNSLIIEWEKETKQKWPVYTNIIYDKKGNPVRNIGDYYDAHHIIENNYGGDHAWWNIIPAKFPNEHQGGIHRSKSPIRKLFK